MIKKLFDYYLKNQSKLVEKFNGKYLIITKDGVVSSWDKDSDVAAYYDAKEKYGMGNFIMQFCSPGEDAYTYHNYHISAVQSI